MFSAMPTPAAPSAAAAAATDALKEKTIKEIVKMWQDELDAHVKEFVERAKDVELLDREIRENDVRIVNLQKEVDDIVKTQTDVNNKLEGIRASNKELQEALDETETLIQPYYDVTLHHQGPRAAAYYQAGEIDADLSRMEDRLRGLIGRLTDMHEAAVSKENPIYQIAAKMNANLDALSAIGDKTKEINQKIRTL